MRYIGHDEPWRIWRAALTGERMHHAWLLSGRKGVGKGPFALAAARELVGGPATGEHPDIIVLSHLPKDDKEAAKRDEGKPFETKRNITIDQIRAMQRRLTTRPTLGERRVIIIDPADDMEANASNALLKSLEEPPVGTFFLLIAHRIGRLLPTIRSRCCVLRFPLVEAAEIDKILQREMPKVDPKTRAAAIAAAAGSPGAALDFVGLGLGDLHDLMERLVRHGDDDFIIRGELAEAMGARPDRQRQLAAIELARAVVAEAMNQTDVPAIPALAEAHNELCVLSVQAPTYNFDPGLLVMEIGSLLAALGTRREPAHG
ncbi:DNA polymerase III subunit delta' [Altererythrobacter salegens]|uniref:DNA polymerase III subunit delta n=1 Tax=Croceibacterium salegens TaxID=1737568 RepID=A0A6I4SVR3_9SPHN|nr:DNA polymerase III subunit delta' [Croceibacterium salegens]MXO58856.1 DNA polymerase III subunit delta' [Croceibacterium salegens]